VEARCLINGRLIDPRRGLDGLGGVWLEEGRIKAVFAGPAPAAIPAGVPRIDLGGRWLVPGLIDIHVHLREPGDEHKETIASGALAAAAGGFTAVACMPNTRPVNDCEAVTALIMARAQGAATRIYPVGAISRGSDGESLAPFGEMRRGGAVAVSDDGRPVGNSQLMRRALEYAGNHDLLVISHPEESSLSHHGAMNEGALATRLGLRGIPRVAEEIMVYRDLALAEYTGRPIHIAHVSTREAVDLIRRAKARGGRVTAETAPHYFTLTEEAVGDYDTRAKMNPPLRTADDLAANGTLDAIATDHAPHSALEKEVEFDLAANGIIGLETSVPLTLALVREGVISPARMIELLAANPARILGVSGGTLQEEAPADLTVIDPELSFTYQAETVVSKSRNSPFLGWDLQGRAVLTILAGRATFEAPGQTLWR